MGKKTAFKVVTWPVLSWTGKKVSFLGRVGVWDRAGVRVWFGVLVRVRVGVGVRVRVWIWNRGTGAAKVMSHECSLASDLVKAKIPTYFRVTAKVLFHLIRKFVCNKIQESDLRTLNITKRWELKFFLQKRFIGINMRLTLVYTKCYPHMDSQQFDDISRMHLKKM